MSSAASSPAVSLRQRRDPVRLKCNELYRIPEPWDLKPGLELIMVSVRSEDFNPRHVGTRIRLAENPIRKREGFSGVYVFYHCIEPAYEMEFYALAEDIVRLPTDRAPHRCANLYWLPQDFVPQA